MIMTAALEKSDPKSCLNKCDDDEPVFVLRARDMYAPGIVMKWAELCEQNGVAPAKSDEARRLADAMRVWQSQHGRKQPD